MKGSKFGYMIAGILIVLCILAIGNGIGLWGISSRWQRYMFMHNFMYNGFHHRYKDRGYNIIKEDHSEYSTTFGGFAPDFSGKNFTGASFEVTFGNMIIDLSQAIILSDCEIDVETTFGNIEIILPRNVELDFRPSSTFGFVKNNFESVNLGGPVVYIEADTTFGLISVR